MKSGKRSKNFTEREKILLLEVAREFVSIIDNKKTDATTVDAKKRAWRSLTNKYNAASETGLRNEKQLHALYDNLKKRARKTLNNVKSEIYKTGSGTFCPNPTEIDAKVVALLAQQYHHIDSEYNTAPYHLSIETKTTKIKDDEDSSMVLDSDSDASSNNDDPLSAMSSHQSESKRPITFTQTHKTYAETQYDSNDVSTSLIKNPKKRINDEAINNKKLEILEIQKQQEEIKLEKTTILFNLDIELKKVLLESAQVDLELKKKNNNI